MSEEAMKALEAAATAKEDLVKEPEPIKADKPAENPDELEATKLGWKPEADFEGEEGWVDAGEFIRRKPLFDAIHKEKRKYKKSQERMEVLVADINQQKEAAVKSALAEIDKAKREAVEDGDTQRYAQLEKREKETTYKPVEAVTEDPVFDKWQETNDWYDSDDQLTRYANGYATELRDSNPDMSNAELYKAVGEEVREAFPTKFSNPARNRAAAVEGGASASKGGRKAEGKITYGDLPEDAKTVYKLLVKSKNNPGGIRTSEEFLDSYQERGGELLQRGN